MKYDVAVVGGGPTGLSAQAATKPVVRLVFSKREDSIAQFVRTSGVTWISDMRGSWNPSRILQSRQNYCLFL
jgi:digeranylgeranylglycerophospholipid reductase